MIFITLGSQKFQFNRLLIEIDKLIENNEIDDEVFAQIGYSDYQPKYFKYQKFLDREKFAETMIKSDIVITHGGTGVIIGAVKSGKKVIAVPRLSKYGEHVDNHQTQLLRQFDGMGMIVACYDLNKLDENYKNLKNMHFNKYNSNTNRIIENIQKYFELI